MFTGQLVGTVNNFGEFEIGFNETVDNPDLFINIIRKNPESPALEFNYTIVSNKDKKIRIKLKFNNPLFIKNTDII